MAGFFEKKLFRDLLAEVVRLYPAASGLAEVMPSEYEHGFLMLRLRVNDRVLLDLNQFQMHWTVFFVESSQSGQPITVLPERGKVILPISGTLPAKKTAAEFVKFLGDNWNLLSTLRDEIVENADKRH